jgi:hypothetical protein
MKLKNIIFFLVLLLLAECVDPVTINTTSVGGILVVNGEINTLESRQQLFIGHTSPDNRIPVPTPGAIVTIINGNGEAHLYEEVSPGVYELPAGAFNAVAGETYYIEIHLSNDKIYRSDPEQIPEANGIDNIYYEFYQKPQFVGGLQVTKNFIAIYTDTELPATDGPLFLKWAAEEVYMFEQTPIRNPLTGTIPLPCFVSGFPDPQRIAIFETKEKSAHTIQRTLVAEREIDHTFLARHYFVLNLSSISSSAHKYWQKVDGLINKSGSMFDTPPAPIHGNVYNTQDPSEQVLGYFGASNTAVSRISTIRNDIPFPILYYCYDPDKGVYSPDYPSECFNCLSLPNSSHEKPDWF